MQVSKPPNWKYIYANLFEGGTPTPKTALNLPKNCAEDDVYIYNEI